MRQSTEIEKEMLAVATLEEITNVFEGVAGLRISKVKNQVLQATKFFNELWQIYSQIRVDSQFRYGRGELSEVFEKELYIIITAEGGLSGDIDMKLIRLMLKTYDQTKNDIIVIGHHGAVQLAQRGIPYLKYFNLPKRDQNINVSPVIQFVQKYRSTIVFYQEYVSLMVQDVRKIELYAAVQVQTGSSEIIEDEIISEKNYLFEPSTFAVIDHLEQSMLYIAISQLILNSKLAQYASRFRAMTMANKKADEARHNLRLEFNRARRVSKDERLKELFNGIKKSIIEI